MNTTRVDAYARSALLSCTDLLLPDERAIDGKIGVLSTGGQGSASSYTLKSTCFASLRSCSLLICRCWLDPVLRGVVQLFRCSSHKCHRVVQLLQLAVHQPKELILLYCLDQVVVASVLLDDLSNSTTSPTRCDRTRIYGAVYGSRVSVEHW